MMVSVYSRGYNLLKGFSVPEGKIPTVIYDRNGEVVAELYHERRIYRKLEDIPLHARNAFLVAEDRFFYSHGGIDPPGIMRALFQTVAGGGLQGGSTITQQVLKSLYLGNARTLERKLMELFMAPQFEAALGKDRILELYLNTIYFGHGAWGIESASQFFFGHGADTLTSVEAAMLAIMPPAPGRYSPLKDPTLTAEKQQDLLYRMARAGLLNQQEAAALFARFWEKYHGDLMVRYPDESVRLHHSWKAPFFVEMIRRDLVKKYGEEMVYGGGMKVYTTLDLRQQEALEKSLGQGIEKYAGHVQRVNRWRLYRAPLDAAADKMEGDRRLALKALGAIDDSLLDELILLGDNAGVDMVSYPLEEYNLRVDDMRQRATLEGAAVILDNGTGGIRALSGGSEFHEENQLNRAVQSRRQPGSAFKPFVYGAAIEKGSITAATVFNDAPILFHQRQKDDWEPGNYDRRYAGKISARSALARSLNIVAVRVYQKTGGQDVARFAARVLNLSKQRFEVDPTLALGTSELTPLEMAAGFAAFSTGGVYVRPYSVSRIQDRRGNTLFEHKDYRRRVMKKETAFIQRTMLEDVVRSGTAVGVRSAGYYGPAAGKTGTTSEFRDAWFAGFTPELTGVIWMGCDAPVYTLGSGISGGVVAAPVWGSMMNEARKYVGKKKFPGKPSGVVSLSVCRHTGLKAGPSCGVRKEWFVRGTEPKEICDGVHDPVADLFQQNTSREEAEKIIDTDNSFF